MSGALARALGAVSAVGNAFTLLTGGSVVTLDSFAFQAFEVPERVKWGGDQKLAVHRFPGGARVIDAMGPDPHAIEWSGVMLGGGAAQRASELNLLRARGDAVTLTWGDFSRTVVVTSCTFDHGHQRIGYQVSCTVLPDDAAGIGGVAPSALDQIKADVNSALGFNVTGTLAGAGSALQSVQAAAAPLVGIVSPNAAAALTGGLGAAADALGGVMVAADAGMAGLADGGNVVSSLSGLPAALSWNGLAANAHAAAGYVGRALANVGA